MPRHLLLVSFFSAWIVLCFNATVHAQQSPYFRIMLEDVEQAVSRALEADGAGNHIEAMLTSTRDKVIHSEYRPIYVDITGLRADKDKATWSANMLVKDNQKIITAKPISGRYNQQIALPVLKDRVRNGHVIDQSNVTTQLFAASKIRSNTLTDAQNIIGSTPRRAIAPFRPIRADELIAPTIVESGDTLDIQYITNAMRITTIGEALEDGGIGDTIRIRNNDSNKVVRARITSAQTALAGGI